MKENVLLSSFILSLVSFSAAIIVSLLITWAGVKVANVRTEGMLLFIVISITLAPLLETAMIASLVGFGERAAGSGEGGKEGRQNTITIIFTTLCMFLLHWIFSGWSAISILPAFYIFTFAYIKFRRKYNFHYGFIVSASTHALHNLYGVTIFVML